jgi:hypothetical protein
MSMIPALKAPLKSFDSALFVPVAASVQHLRLPVLGEIPDAEADALLDLLCARCSGCACLAAYMSYSNAVDSVVSQELISSLVAQVLCNLE